MEFQKTDIINCYFTQHELDNYLIYLGKINK
uniref:Uncharacterized protein n=1 Tax=Moumouvirus sp. 'Monve' TaxID=1128131 RepID=H2EFX9_9VIRU|nr:hypothetical protein mv_L829 [Moumouvirus Monve]